MTWGPMELGIILAIVVLLFGGSKIAGLGRSLGTAIQEFKTALKSPEEEDHPATAPKAADSHGETKEANSTGQ